jgi:Na+:H+ antiporter, NhaA family
MRLRAQRSAGPTSAGVIVRPFQRFARTETSSGVLLLASALVALAWANSPFAAAYFGLWETKLTIGLGGAALSKPLAY